MTDRHSHRLLLWTFHFLVTFTSTIALVGDRENLLTVGFR